MKMRFDFNFAIRRFTQLIAAAALLVTGLALTSPALPAHSSSLRQEAAWTAPHSLGSGWFPDISADRSGRVHVAWASTSSSQTPRSEPGEAGPGYDTVLYTSTADGHTWLEQPADIIALQQGGGSESTRPTLLVDRDGILHMAFRQQTVFYTRAPVAAAGLSTSWIRPFPISVNQVGFHSQLAIDSQGKMHVVFTENLPSADCSNCFHVFYRTSTDGGRNWSIRTDLSPLPTGAPTGAVDPRLLIDAQDHLHVVWEAGRGGANGQIAEPTTVMYTASYDGGASWSAPREFVVPNGRAKNIVIGQDGAGNILAAWLSLPEDLVYSQVSADSGRTWSQPQPIPGVWGGWSAYPARLDGYALAADSAGSLHLVLAGRRFPGQRSLDLLHVAWSVTEESPEGRWSAPEIIASYTGQAPEWPRIAVSSGNQLNVVWFVRDETTFFETDRTNYTIWYARGSSQAPALAPEPFPTATATPAPTPTVFVPTPTATPIDPRLGQLPISPEVAGSIYTENDEVALMGRALLPAAAILLLAIVIAAVLRSR